MISLHANTEPPIYHTLHSKTAWVELPNTHVHTCTMYILPSCIVNNNCKFVVCVCVCVAKSLAVSSLRCTDDFNGAQLKAVSVEAGMIALRRKADELVHEDYMEGLSALAMCVMCAVECVRCAVCVV